MKNNVFGWACLVGTTVFIYQLGHILLRHECWCDFQKPAGFGEILIALAAGLIAIGTAAGVDVTKFLHTFSSLGGDQK